MEGTSVDGTFVGSRRAAVRRVDVGDGSVLVDEERGVVAPLNVTASLIWQCFDGESTLEEICTDLAEGLGASFDTVLADTKTVTQTLSDREFLADPRAPAPVDRVREGRNPGLELSFAEETTHHLVLDVDGAEVNLRSDDEEMLSLLHGALAGYTVEGAPGEADVSLLFGRPTGAIRSLNFLYRRRVLWSRSVDAGRILRAALLHVDAILPPPDGTIRLNARLLVGPDGALVVGGAFLEILELAGPRLRAMGWQLADEPGPLLELEHLDLIVPNLRLALAEQGRAEIDRRFPRSRDEPMRKAARYPILGVLLVGALPEQDKLSSAAQRLAAQAPLVSWPEAPVRAADIEALAMFNEHHDTWWVSGLDDQELLQTIEAFKRRVS